MDFIRYASLIAATVTTGIMAGVFQLYAYTIMPGLGRLDDRTFIGAFQAMDKAIINPLFMINFLGALVFTGLAAALLRTKVPSAWPWIAAAFILYLLVFIITIAINVPMNDALKAAGEPDRIKNLGEVRHTFNEAKWASWNIVRAILTMISFGCLIWALVLAGRSKP
jgi:uncharacterized membrane protein